MATLGLDKRKLRSNGNQNMTQLKAVTYLTIPRFPIFSSICFKNKCLQDDPNNACCDGRVVKALDLKSNGIFPRRFEPCSQRIFVLSCIVVVMCINGNEMAMRRTRPTNKTAAKQNVCNACMTMQSKNIAKTSSQTGNRTPAVAVRARNPDH